MTETTEQIKQAPPETNRDVVAFLADGRSVLAWHSEFLDAWRIYLEDGEMRGTFETEIVTGWKEVYPVIDVHAGLLAALENFVTHNQAMTDEEWAQARAILAKAKPEPR
jgi:hypothetical protein